MSIYDTLNEKQQEAVFQTDGPVLILAGAGSGKTRVLTHRIAYLIDECNVEPWNIMAITFTNKAAKEMRERVDNLVGLGSESIWVSTFHSSCVRMLRRYADRIGYDTNFTIYDADDQKTIMKDVCKRLNIDTKMLKERTILSAISSAKDTLVNPDEFEMRAFGDYNKQKIAKAYREYQNTLKKNNAMDFDDLIMQTVVLFKKCPEVLANYQQRFQYIMVDEYQDTNTAQFELIRLLADANRNLCVVGDDDQSIYKFRGANIRNILDFEMYYSDACVIKLEQNYRSTQNILDAANTVIRNNHGRKEKSLWTEQGKGNRVHFRQFDTALEEAQYVAWDISKKHGEGIEYEDCAILYRTNAQSRLFEEQFIRCNIPYNIVGGVNFYSRKEIKDILAYLKTIDNGKDDLAVKRIINVPKRGIGATTINKVQAYADEHGISFYDALSDAESIPTLGKAASKLLSFSYQIRVFRSRLIEERMSLEDLIDDILEMTQYEEMLREEADKEEDADARIENINELISKTVSYEESVDEPTLSGFLEEVALIADIDRVDGDDNKVLLMTLHSAKGLEFDNVYLAGLEDGIFPSYMTITSDDKEELEEERRLAYVGITRAKKDLTISAAKQRMIRGEIQFNPVSRFVKEIPEELLDNKIPTYKKNEPVYDEGSKARERFRQTPYQGYIPFSPNPYTSFGKREKPKPTPDYAKPFISGFDQKGKKKIEDSDVFDLKKESDYYLQNGGKSGLSSSRSSVYGKAGQTSASAFGGNTNAPNKRQNMPSSQAGVYKINYTVGDRVRHFKFGDGKVLKMEPGPKDTKVTVLFDSGDTKIMYAMFAKLEKI